MRTTLGCLIFLGIAMVLSGCVERHYRPYYYGGYYGSYGYHDRDHHDRRYDDRDRFRDRREDHY